jgi:hypothetical protein
MAKALPVSRAYPFPSDFGCSARRFSQSCSRPSNGRSPRKFEFFNAIDVERHSRSPANAGESCRLTAVPERQSSALLRHSLRRPSDDGPCPSKDARSARRPNSLAMTLDTEFPPDAASVRPQSRGRSASPLIALAACGRRDSDLGPVGQSDGHSAQGWMVNEVTDFRRSRPAPTCRGRACWRKACLGHTPRCGRR